MELSVLQSEMQQLMVEDPISISELCGRVMGNLLRYSEPFSRECALSALKQYEIPARIDFLLTNTHFIPRDSQSLTDSVEWECGEDRIEITGKIGPFAGVRLNINLKDPKYPTCYDISTVSSCQEYQWAFEVRDREYIISVSSNGFLDFQQTKMMILFIYWFSNSLGFCQMMA